MAVAKVVEGKSHGPTHHKHHPFGESKVLRYPHQLHVNNKIELNFSA